MQETLQVINQMQADGVIGRYAIGGAVGASFYLEPTSSLDIDVVVSLKETGGSALASLQPIYDCLRPHDAKPVAEHLLLRGWLVQFLPAEGALNREALELAQQTEVRGVKTWVLSAEHLIAIALSTGSRKDDAWAERFIETESYEAAKLQKILIRYELVERWERVKDCCRATDTMSELFEKVLADKLKTRKTLAKLPFDQKLEIMERMRERSALLAENPLRVRRATTPERNS